MAQADQLPEQTQAAATQEDALPLSKLVLLGTFTGPNGGQALLRSKRGKIYTLSTGDKVEGSEVTGIADGVLILSRKGRTQRLEMPGS